MYYVAFIDNFLTHNGMTSPSPEYDCVFKEEDDQTALKTGRTRLQGYNFHKAPIRVFRLDDSAEVKPAAKPGE